MLFIFVENFFRALSYWKSLNCYEFRSTKLVIFSLRNFLTLPNMLILTDSPPARHDIHAASKSN